MSSRTMTSHYSLPTFEHEFLKVGAFLMAFRYATNAKKCRERTAREITMGIYDREYYRRDGPSLLSRGQACKWLIIINVVVFIMQMLTTSRPDPLDDIGFVG